jgi:hypothetical protein
METSLTSKGSLIELNDGGRGVEDVKSFEQLNFAMIRSERFHTNGLGRSATKTKLMRAGSYVNSNPDENSTNAKIKFHKET